MYLLQDGELLGDVLSAALILAEGDPLPGGEVIRQGAGAGHGQGRSNGEGLVFRHGCRGLHHPGECPLKNQKRDLTREDALL